MSTSFEHDLSRLALTNHALAPEHALLLESCQVPILAELAHCLVRVLAVEISIVTRVRRARVGCLRSFVVITALRGLVICVSG